jgi:murein L,D-transpeptidase YcbB/YkuD
MHRDGARQPTGAVFDNVPEFLTRVVDHGKVIFTEKIVVGKPDIPTPTF